MTPDLKLQNSWHTVSEALQQAGPISPYVQVGLAQNNGTHLLKLITPLATEM
jgi:hypothetical protein